MFIDLYAEFYVLKLLFEDFFPKIIREAGNYESLILRVSTLYNFNIMFGKLVMTYLIKKNIFPIQSNMCEWELGKRENSISESNCHVSSF